MCLSNALTTEFPRNWVIPKRGRAVMIFIKTIEFNFLRRAFDLMLDGALNQSNRYEEDVRQSESEFIASISKVILDSQNLDNVST